MLNRGTIYGGTQMWFRKVYESLIKTQKMIAAVRPGDRTKPGSHSYNPMNTPMPIRIIKRPGTGYQQPGEDTVFIQPELEPDDGTTIQIVGCYAKPLGMVTVDDLRGCAPDSARPELAAYHLGMIYDRLPLGEEEIVTIWRWEYLPKASE